MTSTGPAAPPGPARSRPIPLAEHAPVARVLVDVSLPHLDRPFDYAVPARWDTLVVPGARVRVRFAGRRVDGYVLARADTSDHPGRLATIARATDGTPALSPAVARLARAVADRYAGTMADVLRLAVPPRHLRAESRPWSPGPVAALGPVAAVEQVTRAWRDYPYGPAFLRALADGRAPRAVWQALPDAGGPGPSAPGAPDAIAGAVQVALAAGRGALVVLPDHRDLTSMDEALTRRLGPGHHVVLTADLGPAERWRRYLAVRRGVVRVVVGTRAAVFAPVADLGLVVVWDDGDDLHAEPRAPYPHVREVAVLRADQEQAALLIGGYSRTVEAQQMLAEATARPLLPSRGALRGCAPMVSASGEDTGDVRERWPRARLPDAAWRVVHEAVRTGPVLLQVPRRGYLPTLACQSCRSPARCPHCAGVLSLAEASAVPTCRWCARSAPAWRCPSCGAARLRSMVVGSGRTAEELARAFPGVTVRTSHAGAVLSRVDATPALVVATPGAEPVAEGGYVAGVLLDAAALLARADLRAGEEALRRWLNAARLVRAAGDGGRVVVVGDPGLAPIQALVRWDPGWLAGRELAERTGLGLPPTATLVEITGDPSGIRSFLGVFPSPAGAQVLGPVDLPITGPDRAAAPGGAPGGAPGPGEGGIGDPALTQRVLVRSSLEARGPLLDAVRAAGSTRSLRKAPGWVRVQVDPVAMG